MPEWRVRDVLAHLAGATADIASGNLADVASDEWTGAQVDARRDVPIDEVLDEWARCSTRERNRRPCDPCGQRVVLETQPGA